MPKKILEVEKNVLKYCNDIDTKKIPSCYYTQKAVKRFLNELKESKSDNFEYYMDWNEVHIFYELSKVIHLPDRKEFLSLLPWQLFIHANLIGWRYKSNEKKRRFRSGAVYVPRKNGKTTGLMYPLLIYDLFSSESAEAYFFEKDITQCDKMMDDLRTIIKNSPDLNTILNISYAGAVTYKNSRITSFSAESEGIDGYKPSLAIIDEYFCFPSDRPVTAMRYGSRARENGLVLIITTAGTDISLPAYDEFQKVQKVLNGVLFDDTYFGIIYSTDKSDDWKNEVSFIKANPSIDTIIDRKILKQDLEDALGQTSHQLDYKAKTLNIWTNDTIGWIPLQKWETEKRKKIINDDDIRGCSCWCSFDLSSVNDFSVYTLCFNKDNDYYLRHKFYIPEEQVFEKYRKENIGIFEWIDKGLVTATPGSVIDYDYIYKDIIEDSKQFSIREIAYDRHLANDLTKKLDDELKTIDIFPYPQGIQFFSNPTKQFEKMILEDRIIDNNSCSAWMISNAVIKPDVNGNYKPLKQYKSSTQRIDSVITSIMSLDRCIANSSGTNKSRDFNDILLLFN